MELLVFIIIVVIIIAMIVSTNKSAESTSPSTPYKPNPEVKKDSGSYGNDSDDMEINVVGGFYRSYEAKKYIKQLSFCDTVYFLPEPSNNYDRNAVMVISSTGLHIGYISRDWAKEVKNELKIKDIRGRVSDEAESTYEYWITIKPVVNVEEKNKAISLYLNKKEEEVKLEDDSNKKISLDFYNKVNKAEKLYDMKCYDQVEPILRPFFNAGIQDRACCELMIKTCHMAKKYEEEEKLIDEYLILNQFADRTFWKRRKFHILRKTGVIVSDEQIENEKVGIETTVIELDAFAMVVDLLADDIDPNRLDFRDAKTLFSVNLDDNSRKPICKLYLNNPSKMYIGLIVGTNKSIIKKPLNSIDDIKLYSEQLLDTVEQYFKTTSFSEF